MSEEPTCGQGLADHAATPRLMGRVLEALADTLLAHVPGLVRDNADSEHEKRVYERLAASHREAAALLANIGDEMAGCRDMPMGAHDLDALLSPAAIDALERMNLAEAELVALLQRQVAEHRSILDAMGSGP